MSVSAIDPETVENNPDIERQWAEKAFRHAETYMKLLSSLPAAKLKLTPLDDDIYTNFRTTFPDLNVAVLDEEDLKSPAAKELWRPFIESYKDRVQDYNFGTLLRLNAAGEYDPDNTTFATRLQFFAIEIARNREGQNDVHNKGPQ
ncbi:putative polysaccharide biosynthesis protein [Hyaloraphidium curvatum]|nr:putative polysaccharide biosynthesis protein [Hyaloraphidium curvatum]